MLSYGRVVGRLARLTRHAAQPTSNFNRERIDFTVIGCLRYSTRNKKDKTGKTIKVEECVAKSKSFKRVPPLPPPPPPPPPHASAPPGPPPLDLRPRCEDQNYNCPPCPVNQTGSGGPGEDPGFKYWKQLIAALILAGVSAYAYVEWFMGEGDEPVTKKTPTSNKKHPPKSDPKESSGIPADVPYLLIGGGTAAFAAFRSIKAGDPTAKVLVITNENDIPYMRPPLSKELWYNRDEKMTDKLMFKQWNGAKRSLFYEPPEFFLNINAFGASENGGVSVAKGWEVKKIDAVNKTAYLDDDYAIHYEKCLIATGASPKNLPVFESADPRIKEKIIPFRTKEDFIELAENLKKDTVKNIVVIGGGFLGSELSTSLARNLTHESQKVYQVYKEKYIMSQVLPEYLCKWVTNKSKSEGVKCIPDVEVHDVAWDNGRLNLTFTDGSTIVADQILVAIGVEANTQFAKESNLEIDSEQGGFLVNAELEARSNLWVAGDAACFYDVKLGRRRIEHHDHAVISGKLAGENMTGARKPYTHQSMFWSDLGPQVGFEAIGIIDSSLETFAVYAKEEQTSDSESEKPDEEASEKESTDKDQEKEQKKGETKVESDSNSVEKEVSEEEVKSEIVEDYGKGVIFYLREDVVVGIVLWNIFNRISIARQILERGATKEELHEVAKLFQIHED